MTTQQRLYSAAIVIFILTLTIGAIQTSTLVLDQRVNAWLAILATVLTGVASFLPPVHQRPAEEGNGIPVSPDPPVVEAPAPATPPQG